MSDGAVDIENKRAAAREAAYSEPIETLNPAQAHLFQDDTMWPYFERLRAEDPVHWTPESNFAPHWGITRFEDIMTVDTNHQVFSSEGGITLPISDKREQELIAEGGGPGPGGMFSRPDGEQREGPGGPTMFIAKPPIQLS